MGGGGLFATERRVVNGQEMITMYFASDDAGRPFMPRASPGGDLGFMDDLFRVLLSHQLRPNVPGHVSASAHAGLTRAEFNMLTPFTFHPRPQKKTGEGKGKGKDGEKYKEESTEEPCPVCQMDYSEGDEVVLTPCFHKYHTECLWNWAKDHSICPVCKKNLRDNGDDGEEVEGEEGEEEEEDLE